MSEILKVGDKLVSSEGTHVEIVSVKETTYSDSVVIITTYRWLTYSNPIRPSGDYIFYKESNEIPIEDFNIFSDRETPTLTGQAAINFMNRLREVNSGMHKIPKEEKDRIKKAFDKIMSTAKL